MQNQTENSKRIAKNTILLYLRMMLAMAVSLYTSRVVLNTLGIEDYGIQNVVGGFVSMFSMISGSIGTAILRFLTYDIGTGDKEQLARTFSTSINIQIISLVIIVVLAELIGVWFLNNKMSIPGERLIAANWVFQISLASFCIGLLSVPYNSMIIAYEKMSIFAYFSLLEVFLKLIIVYMLVISPFDKLIFYSSLLLAVAFLIRILYGLYCRYNFPETNYRFVMDRKILREMGNFTGWNYVGASTFILRTQGLNVLMNLFFGVTVNAARGIATQVEAAVTQCVSNLSMAISPQITKSYAKNDIGYMSNLICYGAKYTYFMVLVIITPIMFETSIILELWLKIVPEYTVIFTRLCLLIILVNCICNTLTDAILASGRIRKLQIMAGCVVLPVIPLSYIMFLFGWPAYTCYIPCIISLLVKFLFEIFYARDLVGLSINQFVVIVLFRVIPTSFVILIIPSFIYLVFEESIMRLFLLTFFSLCWSIFSIYYLGLSGKERVTVIEKINVSYRKFLGH